MATNIEQVIKTKKTQAVVLFLNACFNHPNLNFPFKDIPFGSMGSGDSYTDIAIGGKKWFPYKFHKNEVIEPFSNAIKYCFGLTSGELLNKVASSVLPEFNRGYSIKLSIKDAYNLFDCMPKEQQLYFMNQVENPNKPLKVPALTILNFNEVLKKLAADKEGEKSDRKDHSSGDSKSVAEAEKSKTKPKK